MPGSYVGVNLNSGDRAVAQQGLNVSYIHTGLQQGGSKRVTKHMGRDMTTYINLFQVFIDNSTN